MFFKDFAFYSKSWERSNKVDGSLGVVVQSLEFRVDQNSRAQR